MELSYYIVPIIVILVILYAVFNNPSTIFESFIEGATRGVHVTFSIMPTLIGLITAVSMLKSSGALEMLIKFLTPFSQKINFPAPLVPLAILKPISGSASTAIFNDILKTYGANSVTGKIASLIAGSTETTFYVITIYFGSVGIKHTKHCVTVALLSDLLSIILSTIIVSIIWNN